MNITTTNEELEAIIREDLQLLKKHQQLGGLLGEFLDAGSYGFVMEYREDPQEEKVIKILDPKYVQCSFRETQPQQHSTLLAQRAVREWDLAQKVGYTKSPHLMPLMNSPKKIHLEDRAISFLVMPRLKTIEQLEPEANKARQAVAIIRDCCSGLQVLHREPETVGGRKNGMDALVHCDIKPNNIFWVGDPPRFMLGDYSIAQRIRDLEEHPLSFPASANAYCAQGPVGETSDLYALGWVLYYWMNNKVHPLPEEEAVRRAAGTLTMPPAWGDNPELWEVFWKLTDPEPANRYQKAEDVSAALSKALQAREDRVAGSNALQRYDAGKTEGQLEAAGLLVLISVCYTLLKEIFGPEPIPSDGNGRLHGTTKKKIDYLGGKFQGQWEHGAPKQGTFYSSGGKKCTGQWQVVEDLRHSYLNTGSQSFTGLVLVKDGQPVPYQGKLRITWPWGTIFTCDLEADRIGSGTMTFPDGTSHSGQFVLREDSFGGIFREGKDGRVTGAGFLRVCPGVTLECDVHDNVPAQGCVFLPGSRRITHEEEAYERVVNLLVGMRNTQSSFQGTWDDQGLPREGKFLFSNRRSASGTFGYVENQPHSKGTYTGMVGDDGLPWGIGTLCCRNEKTVTGQFFKGKPLK